MKIQRILNTVLLTTTLAGGAALAQGTEPVDIQGVLSQRTAQRGEQNIEVLSVPSGLTVYTFDPDVGGVPTCYDRCAEVWPPVTLSADEANALQAPLGVVQRRTGLRQLTYNGQPLYLFNLDRRSGDIKGDGVGTVWHLIEVSAP